MFYMEVSNPTSSHVGIWEEIVNGFSPGSQFTQTDAKEVPAYMLAGAGWNQLEQSGDSFISLRH